MWYGFVSLPLFQFLCAAGTSGCSSGRASCGRFRASKLSLVPTHPDGTAASVSSVGTAYAFACSPSGTALLAGMIANRIFYLGAKLLDFKVEIARRGAFVLVLVLGPLLVFWRSSRRRGDGMREYGPLAGRYVREFHPKWMRDGPPAGSRWSAAPTSSRSRISATATTWSTPAHRAVHAGASCGSWPRTGTDGSADADDMPFEELVIVLLRNLL